MTHRVDLARLDGFVEDMSAFDREVERRIEELDAQMARLHALWQGEAEQAQRAAHADLMKGIARMRHGLGVLRQAARTAHGNYGAAVAANEAMMNEIG